MPGTSDAAATITWLSRAFGAIRGDDGIEDDVAVVVGVDRIHATDDADGLDSPIPFITSTMDRKSWTTGGTLVSAVSSPGVVSAALDLSGLAVD
jgi:hypothetical protein